jgi:hypothetical protein
LPTSDIAEIGEPIRQLCLGPEDSAVRSLSRRATAS